MKLRFLVLPVLLLLGIQVMGQKKQLTLEDAIINRYRALAPDRLPQLQWVPGGHSYSYVDKNELIEVSKLKKKKVLFSLKTVNLLLNDSLKRMPYFSWAGKQSLAFFYKGEKVVINDNASKVLSKTKYPKGSNLS